MRARDFAGLLLAAWLLTDGAHAATSRSAQKQTAESERAELRNRLKSMRTEVYKTEAAKEQASDSLAESEQAISEANRSLKELREEQRATEDKLQQLQQQRVALQAQADQQKNRLAQFLRQQYMHGSGDRLKLLLSGDDPNRINRDLQYMGYVSRTQARMIDALHESLRAVEQNEAQTQEAKADLDEIAVEQQAHKSRLEKEKKTRGKLLTQLGDKLRDQRKQIDQLQKNEQMLNALVARLSVLIEEQARAERAKAARLEKQRQEKLAQEREKNRDRKPDASRKQESPPSEPARPFLPPPGGSEFVRLKGRLTMPLKGELLAKYGSKREEGVGWKGLYIRAAEGTPVTAIAAGTVVLSDWMRGYGNLLIVDHGGDYLSLYAYNQAVLKHEGDVVKAGEVIANAGNSGGNEVSGLYFELRYKGRAFDPQSWMASR